MVISIHNTASVRCSVGVRLSGLLWEVPLYNWTALYSPSKTYHFGLPDAHSSPPVIKHRKKTKRTSGNKKETSIRFTHQTQILPFVCHFHCVNMCQCVHACMCMPLSTGKMGC